MLHLKHLGNILVLDLNSFLRKICYSETALLRSSERWILKEYCLLNATKKRQVRAEEQKSKNCKNWNETRSVRESGSELTMDEGRELLQENPSFPLS